LIWTTVGQQKMNVIGRYAIGQYVYIPVHMEHHAQQGPVSIPVFCKMEKEITIMTTVR
jgi:hypothetical protein